MPFFYTGLAFIVVGTGLLKPNVSSMVGALYEKDDNRRDAGFSIFYMGINLGAFIAPIVCGFLGQSIDWHLGFAAAGVGMVFGLIQYVLGKKYLRAVEASTPLEAGVPATVVAEREPLSRADWARIGAAIILTLFALLFWAGFEQAGSSLTLFADRATRLSTFGFNFPSSLFQSAEPLFVILLSPVFAWLWIRMGRREPSSPAKFTMGLLLLSLAFALIVPAARIFERSGQRVSPGWLIGLYLFQALGELCLSPVGLSMVTKLSPPRLVGMMMGIWFFATAMGNYVAGWAAGFLQDRQFSEVFMAAFVSVLVASVVLALLIKPIKKMMGGVN